MNEIKANAIIRAEQDINLIPKNSKLGSVRQPNDEMPLTTDRQFKRYNVIEDHVILKKGLFFLKNYGETEIVTNYQFLIPKRSVNEVLRRLHAEFGKHSGNIKTDRTFFVQVWQS